LPSNKAIWAILQQVSGPSDGRKYPVRHAGMLLIAPRSLAVVDKDREIVTPDGLHNVAIKDLRPRANGSPER
jgi:hypothetical protein